MTERFHRRVVLFKSLLDKGILEKILNFETPVSKMPKQMRNELPIVLADITHDEVQIDLLALLLFEKAEKLLETKK